MDSEHQQCYEVAPSRVPSSADSARAVVKHIQPTSVLERMAVTSVPPVIEGGEATEILAYLQSGQLWRINARRRNGLILYKGYHAEFAGPGAAVGGLFDLDCQFVIPVGNLSMAHPKTHKERQEAYLIRRQWIKLTQQFTDQSAPTQRAQMILTQFETYFDQETIARIPDEAFAMLVGVLPYSVRTARRTPGKLHVKVKT